MNSNKELLDWAVENIKEWDDEFTHLRGDSSIVSIFFTKGNWVISGRNIDWVGDFFKEVGLNRNFNPPQVITKQEWLDAKKEKENMSNTFNLKDLKTGQRITFENGDKYVVFKDTPHIYNEVVDFVVEEGSPTNWEHLTYIDISEVVKVETPNHPYTILCKSGWEGKYKTIWERQVKSEQDIEKENLQKVIDKLQQDLQNAQQQLDNLGGK